jgi:hypothetical protein
MFKPTAGWSAAEAFDSPPESIVSGHNVWIENKKLKPRSGLSQLYPILSGSATMFDSKVDGLISTRWGAHAATPSGASQEPGFWLVGVELSMDSGTTVGAFNPTIGGTEGAGTWSELSLVTAGGKDQMPQGSQTNDVYRVFDTIAYMSTVEEQGLVFGITPLSAPGRALSASWWPNVWIPNEDTYSYLTGAPRVYGDVITFDNSPIVWGADTGITKVQWPTGADIFDWTGIGSGFDLLVDMVGRPTRAFATEDQMILASTEEIWRGRKIGGAYRFAFSPLNRSLGMPLPFAAIQTPFGIFWLNDDYMVYRLQGNAIEPVGQAILQTLRDNAYISYVDPSTFFSYDPRHLTLTLHYATASGEAGSTKAFTLHLAEGMVWTPQTFGKALQHSTTCAVENVGTTTHGTSVEENAFFGSYDAGVYYYSDTTNKDFGVAKEAQWMSGGLFIGDPDNTKFLSELKIDARADSTSDFTVKVSGNLGGAFATGSEHSFSVQSNTSQIHDYPKVSGAYHTVMLTSEDTGWEVSRLRAKAVINGETY